MSSGGLLTALKGKNSIPGAQAGATSAEDGEKETEDNETPTIQEDDGYIIIDGVSLPINREQMRASWIWR